MVGMWLGSLGRIVCYVCGSINELWWVVMGYWGPEGRVYIALGWRRDAHSGVYMPQLIVV